MRIVVVCVLLLLVFTAVGQEAAQEKKIIQLTGVVFNQDSTGVVDGVHIYIPKGGRGTTTNPYGFFSLPVLEGDSLVFSAVGYKRSYYVVPHHDAPSSLRLIITLKEDVQFLEEVEIRPYPTEAMFKEALVTMDLPYEREYANIYQWMNSEIMERGYVQLRASPAENHRYFMQQYYQTQQNRYQMPQNNFLNPFAWSQFISGLLKKKDK